MVLAYRRVVSKGGDNADYISSISNLYIKVRTVWKYNPDLYLVVKRNEAYKAVKSGKQKDSDVIVGTLSDLYKDLVNLDTEQFTDDRTGRCDYRIGIENRMHRASGNQSNKYSCSDGFHLASKAYDYSYFGDAAVLCVFNPMDTLAVPQGESGKLRVCAFTILATLDGEEENAILDSADLSELVIDHYEDQVAGLEDLLSRNTPYELSINNILNGYETIDIGSIMEHARKSIEGKLIMLND